MYTWLDAAQWLFEGAAALEPLQYDMFDGLVPTAACAFGAMHYGATRALGLRQRYVLPDDADAYAAMVQLRHAYSRKFNATIIGDNDLHDRQYVLDRVQELVDAA